VTIELYLQKLIDDYVKEMEEKYTLRKKYKERNANISGMLQAVFA